jgi:hypothetical protein
MRQPNTTSWPLTPIVLPKKLQVCSRQLRDIVDINGFAERERAPSHVRYQQ